MTRDIRDRLALFGSTAHVDRIALTMSQVEQYDPPPNPAKITDSRAEHYIAVFGTESWELDALSPEVLDELITRHITSYLDEEAWAESTANMNEERQLLRAVSDQWVYVAGWVS